jgi:hypothetical protein
LQCDEIKSLRSIEGWAKLMPKIKREALEESKICID